MKFCYLWQEAAAHLVELIRRNKPLAGENIAVEYTGCGARISMPLPPGRGSERSQFKLEVINSQLAVRWGRVYFSGTTNRFVDMFEPETDYLVLPVAFTAAGDYTIGLACQFEPEQEVWTGSFYAADTGSTLLQMPRVNGFQAFQLGEVRVAARDTGFSYKVLTQRQKGDIYSSENDVDSPFAPICQVELGDTTHVLDMSKVKIASVQLRGGKILLPGREYAVTGKSFALDETAQLEIFCEYLYTDSGNVNNAGITTELGERNDSRRRQIPLIVIDGKNFSCRRLHFGDIVDNTFSDSYQVKVDSIDPTPGFLADKIVPGNNIEVLNENNKLKISNFDFMHIAPGWNWIVRVSSFPKCQAWPNLTAYERNEFGVEGSLVLLDSLPGDSPKPGSMFVAASDRQPVLTDSLGRVWYYRGKIVNDCKDNGPEAIYVNALENLYLYRIDNVWRIDRNFGVAHLKFSRVVNEITQWKILRLPIVRNGCNGEYYYHSGNNYLWYDSGSGKWFLSNALGSGIEEIFVPGTVTYPDYYIGDNFYSGSADLLTPRGLSRNPGPPIPPSTYNWQPGDPNPWVKNVYTKVSIQYGFNGYVGPAGNDALIPPNGLYQVEALAPSGGTTPEHLPDGSYSSGDSAAVKMSDQELTFTLGEANDSAEMRFVARSWGFV